VVQAVREPSALSLCNLAPQRRRIDEVHEGTLAVDLDDREPLSIPRFERCVACDVDLVEARSELGSQHAARLLAQMATLGVEEDDARDRSRG
jgi:hypothetical protein